MFTVQPLLTAAAERRLLGNLQAGIEQRGVNRCLPFRLERARIDGDPLLAQVNFQRIGNEQFTGIAPQVIDCLLHTLRRV